MALIPVLLAIIFTIVLAGGAFFATSPSRGESADRQVGILHDRMRAHPVRSYYFPQAVGLLLVAYFIREAVGAESIEGRIGQSVLVVLFLLIFLLMVRLWRWPKGLLSQSARSTRD